MQLSASSRAELEEFFREFREDEYLRLPPVRVYAGRAAGWLTGRTGIDAITLGRRVLVAPHHLRRGDGGARSVVGRLIAHEVAHLLQAERAGLVPFLLAYLREYLKGMRRAPKWDAAAHWRAYSEISFEREAREAERAYEAWRAGRGKS
jgi:hypothetical protein